MRVGGACEELADSSRRHRRAMCAVAAPAARRTTVAGAARTRPDRASQHRPACDRVSRAGCWRRFVCRRHRDHAGAQPRARGAAWKPGRATRSRGCATNSIAPKRCCFPNRRSSWFGRRDPTSPASTAIPPRVGVSASHRVLAFGSWLDAGKATAMERAVDGLARARRSLRDDAHDAVRSADRSARPRHRRPRRAPPQRRQRHQARTRRAGRPATRNCRPKPRRCARWSRRCRRRSGRATRRAG